MDCLLFFTGSSGDLRLHGGDLLADDSLYTAVVISLFTDARAADADELPPEYDRSDLRGFWGDALGGESIGSRLWLLAREKDMARVRVRAEQYAREALAWLTRDGLAGNVEVEVGHPASGACTLSVSVTYPDKRTREPRTSAWNFKLHFDNGGSYAVEPANA